MSIRTRPLLLAALLTALAPAAACGDKADNAIATSALDAVGSDPTSCREEFPEGVVAFAVAPDGGVRAGATGADGQPAKIQGGTLAFRKDGAAPTEAKLVPEGDGTTASAKGPAMDASVTAIDYAVDVGGKTLKGILHLPSGGTKALAESAKTAPPEDAPGPNGGQVQLVGGEPVEVAVAPSGDVAAYVLDKDRKTVVTADRTVWLLVDGEKVMLTRRDDGAYFGRTAVLAPHKVTLVLVREGRTHVTVVGYRPGVKLLASRAPGIVVVKTIAPKVVVHVSPDDPGPGHSKGKKDGHEDKNPDEPGLGHAKGKEKKKDDHKDKDKGDKVDGPDKNKGAGNDKSGGKDKGGGKK